MMVNNEVNTIAAGRNSGKSLYMLDILRNQIDLNIAEAEFRSSKLKTIIKTCELFPESSTVNENLEVIRKELIAIETALTLYHKQLDKLDDVCNSRHESSK